MGFHDIRFPPALSFGSLGGPQRLTEVVELANGHEERNTPWAQSRRRYDAGVAMRSMADVEQVIAFFEARRGQVYAFRWKDWTDYKSGPSTLLVHYTDQVIGIGDDVTATWQLVKTYRSGDQSYTRQITKPVDNTVLMGLAGEEQSEGIHYEVDLSTGIVTFAHPPNAGDEITAGFEFDVPVRFDTDHLAVSASSFQAGEVPSMPVIEVRA